MSQQPSGIHHLAFMAGDIKKHIAFFSEVMGCPLVALFDMHGVPGGLHAFLRMNEHSYFSIVQLPDVDKIPIKLGETHAGLGVAGIEIGLPAPEGGAGQGIEAGGQASLLGRGAVRALGRGGRGDRRGLGRLGRRRDGAGEAEGQGGCGERRHATHERDGLRDDLDTIPDPLKGSVKHKAGAPPRVRADP